MKQESLFAKAEQNEPLAARVRPQSLDQFVGQQHLLGPGKILREIIAKDQVSSMIFWGPPGVGKTTLAEILQDKPRLNFGVLVPSTAALVTSKKLCNRPKLNVNLAGRQLFL